MQVVILFCVYLLPQISFRSEKGWGGEKGGGGGGGGGGGVETRSLGL